MVLTWLSTGRGGAEESTAEVAAGLAACGITVTVVWWQAADGVDAPHLAGVRVLAVTDREAYPRVLLSVLTPESVVISNHRTMLVDLPVCLSAGAPVAVVLRGLFVRSEPIRVVDPNSLLLVGWPPERLPWGRLSPAAWVGISRASAASIASWCSAPERVRTIYCGVTLPDRFAVRPVRPQGRLRLVAAGRACAWKRLDVIVEAVARLPQPVWQVTTLDVYGDGPDLPRLRRQTRELGVPVRIHGHVAGLWRERVPAADVLVTAAVMEGFGRVVAQAAGVGLVAVVPRGGASEELVLDGVTGLVYDPDRPGGLTEAITQIASMSDEQLVRMGQVAFRHARALWTSERCTAEWLSLCHHLATARPHGAVAVR